MAPATAPTASAANTFLTNPLGFAYSSVTGVAQYAHPAGMLITGPCNRYAPEFASARVNGAEVLAYLTAVSRPDEPSNCPLVNGFYIGDPTQVPPSGGMTADFKRASKFTLTDKATLLRFSAYLDGQGGTAGTQSVRIALYRDSAGVPGTFVAQSNTVSVTSGTVGNWYTFTAPAAALSPGDYWIAIHTGLTAGVARNRGGDTPNNWYGNADTFSDGASSPFGTPGPIGNGTLSVNASYTVGQ